MDYSLNYYYYYYCRNYLTLSPAVVFAEYVVDVVAVADYYYPLLLQISTLAYVAAVDVDFVVAVAVAVVDVVTNLNLLLMTIPQIHHSLLLLLIDFVCQVVG